MFVQLSRQHDYSHIDKAIALEAPYSVALDPVLQHLLEMDGPDRQAMAPWSVRTLKRRESYESSLGELTESEAEDDIDIEQIMEEWYVLRTSVYI